MPAPTGTARAAPPPRAAMTIIPPAISAIPPATPRTPPGTWASAMTNAAPASRSTKPNAVMGVLCPDDTPRDRPRRRLCPVVAHDLDVVAVGVEHVGRVVAGVVARALARRAVVAVAGGGERGVEPVGCRVVAAERHVEVAGGLACDERERGAVGPADR